MNQHGIRTPRKGSQAPRLFPVAVNPEAPKPKRTIAQRAASKLPAAKRIVAKYILEIGRPKDDTQRTCRQAIKNVARLLADHPEVTEDLCYLWVDRYKRQCDAQNCPPERCYSVTNFFGRAAYWEQFTDENWDESMARASPGREATADDMRAAMRKLEQQEKEKASE